MICVAYAVVFSYGEMTAPCRSKRYMVRLGEKRDRGRSLPFFFASNGEAPVYVASYLAGQGRYRETNYKEFKLGVLLW